MLMQYSLYMILPHLKYKYVEKGIVSGSSEETTQTSLDELKYLRETALETAQFYDERMREFLRDYPTLFPIYQIWNTKGMSPNRETAYFSGLQTNIPRRTWTMDLRRLRNGLRSRLQYVPITKRLMKTLVT